MKFIKGFLCASVAVLALSFSGCKKDSQSESNGSNNSKSSEPSSSESSASIGKFSPKVSENAVIALGLNLDLHKMATIGETFFDQGIATLTSANGDTISETKQITEMKKEYMKFVSDPFKEAPADFIEFVDEVGLRNAKVGWAVLSAGEIKLNSSTMPDTIPETMVAIATDINVEKIVAYAKRKVEETSKGEFKIDERTIAGEKAWWVVPQKETINQDFKSKNLQPCFASLDGQLVLLASTPTALERQIRLYREGKGEGQMLREFRPANGGLVLLAIKDLGAILRNLPSQRNIRLPMLQNGNELIQGIQKIELALASKSGQQLALTLKLRTASDEDADNLRTLAKRMIAMAQNPKSGTPKNVADSVKRLEIAGTRNEFEVHFDDILPLFSGLALPNFIKYRQTSRQAACISNLKQLQAAAEMCLLSGKPITEANLFGPNGYIKRKPTCPCGGEYIILVDKDKPEGYSSSCPNAKTDPKFPHVLPGEE